MLDNLKADLRTLLEGYEAFDADEEAHAARLRDFLETGGDIFARDNPIGQVTASAMVVNRQGTDALLTHHAKLDRWVQFGGHVESEEDVTILGAAIREAMEESGVDGLVPDSPGIFDIDVHAIPANAAKGEPAHMHFDVRFLLIAPSADYVVSDESHDLRWYSLSEMALLFANEPPMRRMVQKLQLMLPA